MALIQCPECQREISDTAPQCPQCGYALATTRTIQTTGKKWQALPLLTLLAAITCVVLGWHFFLMRNLGQDWQALLPIRQGSISINPVTNLVWIRTSGPGKLTALGNRLRGLAVQTLQSPAYEEKLNEFALHQWDLYALVIPYRVRFVITEEETPVQPPARPQARLRPGQWLLVGELFAGRYGESNLRPARTISVASVASPVPICPTCLCRSMARWRLYHL